jgi:alpha-D-ribose 1-methylphosphonate 5-triphosphate synthase subunit PhnG
MPLSPDPAIAARQRWMAVLARADESETAELLAGLPPLPAHTVLRGPEIGLVMVRGRIGGGGGPFNLGEMTVTRCTVRAGGQVGHATVAGRHPGRAVLAARLDAALQDPVRAAELRRAVVEPLAARQAAARAEAAERAAATRVQFFTLQTMRT